MAEENRVHVPNISNPETRLMAEINDEYEASFMHKDSLGLLNAWATFENYYQSKQNEPEDADDPASVTNIIHPTIESLVSELVETPMEILVKGYARGDRAVAPLTQMALEWVWEHNNPLAKRDRFERIREKFGTAIWKTYFDGDAGAVGMPRFEPVSPVNFFPDPKIRAPEALHQADFVIHAVSRPLKYLRRIYPNARDLVPNPNPQYDPEAAMKKDDALTRISKEQTLVLERWSIERDGRLRKIVMTNDPPRILYDSDRDGDREQRKRGYYFLDRYPFTVVPCYRREDMLWGMGDVELLKPIQDIINDLDDQIRLNARLMGNLQIVIGIASGINPYFWTNKPGLKIPARDPRDWVPVQPQGLPEYILARRNQALTFENEMISGRTDITEGRRPGSLRAASAILALQQAGSRRVNHKKLLTRLGLEDVLSIITDYITEYWTEAIDIGVTEQGEEIFFRGSALQEVPVYGPDGTEIRNEDGSLVTRPARFAVRVNLGEGMPADKAFVYQAVLELGQFGFITREEGRMILQHILSWPIIDPLNPQGQFVAGQDRIGNSILGNQSDAMMQQAIQQAVGMGGAGLEALPGFGAVL